jgi:hypothetical protein
MTALALESAKAVIRRSLAESLLTCTEFEREDGEQLAFGTAFHSFAAAYILLCQSSGEETRHTDVARLSSEAWARTHGLLQSRYSEFMELCERWASSHLANLETLLHVEHTETLDVGFAILTATMDRIDRADMGDPDEEPRRELVTDHKSEQGEMDHTFQEFFYIQMRLLNHPALEEVGLHIDPVRDRWSTEPTWYSRGQLDLWWKTMLAGLRDRVQGPRGNPTGGPACNGCAKRYHCPKALAVAREIPETEEQADEQFAELLRLEEAVTVRKAGQELFYRDREDRVVVGKEIGFLRPRAPHLVITAKPKELRTWLNRHHMDGEVAMKVDSEQIGKSGIRDKLVTAGLATLELGRPVFKWRNHVPARAARAEKKRKSESDEERSE